MLELKENLNRLRCLLSLSHISGKPAELIICSNRLAFHMARSFNISPGIGGNSNASRGVGTDHFGIPFRSR